MDEPIQPLVDALDSKRSLDIEHAWTSIRSHGLSLMPYFIQAYPRFKTATGRAALVFYATQYARVSDDAFKLGCNALQDRAKVVRERACGLLAYSLRPDAITHLSGVFADGDATIREAAKAGVTAIRMRNHHLFADRTGSGRVQWIVNPEDRSVG